MKKIMLVDDSAMMRTIIRNLLEGDPQIEVAGVAANGQEALDLLAEAKPDLILLDIEMPVMTGLEFLPHARLKTKAKIVILSSIAIAGSEAASKAKELGADAIISKPSGAVSFDLAEKRGSEIRQVIYEQLSLPMN
ncbi:MAG: response regulator [Gammaproteobacteria bacterium]